MPLSITELGAIRRWIHSPVKHLWWSFLRNCSQIKAITAKAKNKRSITNFAKSSIIGAWQGRTLRFRLLQKDCKFYFGHSYQLNPQIPTKYVFTYFGLYKKGLHISSVIKQNDKSQNGNFKKTKQAKFSEKRTFLIPPDMFFLNG